MSLTARTRIVDDELASWGEPEPLGTDLPAVEKFTLDLLPTSFRALVEDTSERMQTPPDYAAAACVVALAGCVNRRARIQPKEHDDSWQVVPKLWGALVGPPGFLKSPVMRAITRPLDAIEELWRNEYENQATEHDLEQERTELRHRAWQQESVRALKRGVAIPQRPDTSGKPPAQRRLVLMDSTVEKLHEILRDNPAGVLVLRDELTGWLAELDRQGREGERAFFLQAWNGDSGFTIDRVGRGSIHVPAVCVSMLGCIQPARLRSYLVDALNDGPANDGLMQRFQVVVWPDPPTGWELVDRPPNRAAIAEAGSVYEKLAGLSTDDAIRLRFSGTAQGLFNAFLRDLETKVRRDDLHPALVSHLAKFRSLMPTLAGLFTLSEWACGRADCAEISLESARRAAAWTAYLESHARRVYSCIVSPEVRAARELAEKIRRGKLPRVFSVRAIYNSGWSFLDTPDRARDALRVLQEAAWVRPLVEDGGPGRPPERYKLNPRLEVNCE